LSDRPIGGTPLNSAERQAVQQRYPTTVEQYNNTQGVAPITDETVVYRWSPEANGLGGNGMTFWTTNAPIQGYETRYLFRTTVGELRSAGADIRMDHLATGVEEGSESVIAFNNRTWNNVPGVRMNSVAKDHSGLTPLFLDSQGRLVTSQGEIWNRGIRLPSGERVFDEDLPDAVERLRGQR
jgi:hypothetical protein